MTRVIDGVLKEWGDRLYYPSVKGKGRKCKNIRGGSILLKKNNLAVKPISFSIRDKLLFTVGKVSEVMVKISGGGKNMRHIKAHMDYISRKGEVEMEDENGDRHLGKDGILDVRDAWAKGKLGIPLDGERRREAFNIVLSMPPGTNRKAVKDAARAFAAEQFGNHQYIFVAHDDEKHPHIHLTVKAVDKSCIRMNPRKADLQRWREHFADKLREQGIAANATVRRIRGIVRKGEKQAIRHIARRGAKSTVRAGQKADVIHDIKTGEARENPLQQKILKTRKETLLAFGEVARLLSKSAEKEDKVLAIQIVDFVKTMPSIQTFHQHTVEAIRTKLEQTNLTRDTHNREGHQDRTRG